MVLRRKISVSIQTPLAAQAKTLARQFNISTSRLFEIALEAFLANHYDLANEIDIASQKQSALKAQENTAKTHHPDAGMAPINQGDIYWLELKNPDTRDIAHPHVVIQDNVFNHSRLNTVIVCALTSNLKRVTLPGNVLLDPGEANLTRQSLVEVSKVSSVAKTQLGDYIGSLSQQRVDQILDGMRFIQTSYFPS